MDSENHIYRRCRNCNAYFETEADSKEIFCSAECRERYGSCQVCGRYFRLKDGVDDRFCSAECFAVLNPEPRGEVSRLS